MKKIIIRVEGMVCNGCATRIQNALKSLNGVEEVIANYTTNLVTATATDETKEDVLKSKIEDIGFKVKEN